VRIDWDGDQTRDYIYVKDIANLNVLALERGSGMCYAIGTNLRTSVNDIYHTLVEISGFEAPVTHGTKRSGDARDAQFDAALAKKELGWKAQTKILDGMRETYEYFKGLVPA
jgi:UDP-glucose 4-epimerase